MSAIWLRDGDKWRAMAARQFADEAALHDLVEEAPQLLPLSGAPRLVVVGREVQLGGGYADLVALDPDGQVAIIEIKLARNSEARRAVIAQVLGYGAALMGTDPQHFERNILGGHLARRGYADLADAVRQNDQEGSFDADTFGEGLTDSLAKGRLRLVIVLDSAPDELVRIGAFLESVSDRLTVDLVTVSDYAVGDTNIMVPQRVDPGRTGETATSAAGAKKAQGQLYGGSEVFAAAITEAPAEEQLGLQRLLQWAKSMEERGLARFHSYAGIAHRWTLLPYLPDISAGLITIWNENGAAIQFWRSVFEKKAPRTMLDIEAHIAPKKLGQGTTTREINDKLLDLLTRAYQEGAG